MIPQVPSPIGKRLWPVGFLLLLVGVVAYAYGPSLRHLPRADQWAYLLDTLGRDGFGDIASHTWSYSRTRRVGPGDTQLFRPLLFMVLAAEKALFGNHFFAWHLVGIALHLLVCGLLFSLLRRLRTLRAGIETSPSPVDWLPYLLTLFFAVNYAIVDQVIWEHIIGYLVFTVLVLAALRLLLEISAEPGHPRPGRLLASAWLLVLLATFTYELGQLVAIGLGFYLAAVHLRRQRPRRALALLSGFVAIVVLYQSVNLFDRWHHRATYVDDLSVADVLARFPTTSSLKNLGRYLCYALVQPFLPAHCPSRLLQMGKMTLAEPLWTGQLAWDARVVCCLAIFGLGSMLALLGLIRLRRSVDSLLFLLLVLGIAASHAALIVCGRLNVRPEPEQLTLNPYYIYISLLFLLLSAAVPLLSLDRLWPASPVLSKAVTTLLVGLFILSIVSLDVTRRLNVEGAQLFRRGRSGNQAMLKFLRQHEAEPGFCLAVVRGPKDEASFAPTTQILYHRYLNASRPTYLVREEQGRLRFSSVAQWHSEHPGEVLDLYPDLVSVQPRYHVFKDDDRYYAVPHRQYHAFLVSSEHSRFPLVRGSLRELYVLLGQQTR